MAKSKIAFDPSPSASMMKGIDGFVNIFYKQVHNDLFATSKVLQSQSAASVRYFYEIL